MYQITINHKSGPKDYPIYTVNEAEDEKIKYIHWKCAEEGDFCLSDDGYVGKVIKRTRYKNLNTPPTLYLRAPWGYIMHKPTYKEQKFYAEGRSTPWTLTGKPIATVCSRSQKWKNLALAYVSTNFEADLAIDIVFGQVTPSQRRRWRRNIKRKEFKEMVREELNELLETSGKDTEYVMELLDETIVMAKEKKDVTNLMRAVEKLMDLHGMNDKDRVQTTHQIEGVSSSKLLADVLEEEKRLIATTTVTENNGRLREEVPEKASTKEV